MQILNEKIKAKFQIRYTVRFRTEAGAFPLIKTINDTVCALELPMIPDIKDNIKVNLLPGRYKSISKYLENGKPVAYFSGSGMFIDCTEKEPILAFNQDCIVTIYEKELKEYATTNINKPEWKDEVSIDDLRKLSIDDIFNLYHQTMHRGVDM